MEGVIAEHDAIKREVGLLRQLVEKLINMQDGERKEDLRGVNVVGSVDANTSIRAIFLYGLERVEVEDEARSEQAEEEIGDNRWGT
jgi:hypothetical protein